jgi:hypothetical protein
MKTGMRVSNLDSRILIIGSGPTAFASLCSTVESVDGVDVCVGSFRNSKSRSRAKKHVKLKLAKRISAGREICDEYPCGPRLTQTDTAIRTSFNSGGLSLIWGAALPPIWNPDEVTWSRLMSDLIQELYFLSQYVPISRIRTNHFASINFVANTREIPVSNRIDLIFSMLSRNSHLTFGISSLAINETRRLDFSGKLSASKSGLSFNDLWVADVNSIIHSKSFNTDLLENCRVIDLREIAVFDQPMVEVKFQNDDGQFFIRCYSKVFVAAGCVESFRILSASGLCPLEVKMLDTQIEYCPIIDLSLNRIFKSLFDRKKRRQTFSQLWLKGETSNCTKYYVQFYELTWDLISSISGVKGRLLRLITPFIRHFILVGILYKDSSVSPTILLNAQSDGVESKSSDTNHVGDDNFREAVSKEAKKVKLLFLFSLSLKGTAGESAHFGAWAPMGKTTDYLGRFHPNSNIHLVDASVLPEILPGPITLFAMANASRITRQTFLD